MSDALLSKKSKTDAEERVVEAPRARVGETSAAAKARFIFIRKIVMKRDLFGGIKRQPYLIEHAAWRNMVQRCVNPKNQAYNSYGGRGIIVCDRWLHSFDNF